MEKVRKKLIREKAVIAVYQYLLTNATDKEIENYLPTEALHNYFDSSQNVEQFSFFPDIYKNIKKVETFDKVKFALDITKNKNYTKENLAKCLDLHEQTEMLIDFIRKSNQEIC